MQLFLIYGLGIVTGFIIALAWGMHIAQREQKKLQEKASQIVDKIKDEMKKEAIWSSARQRFDKAAAIAEQQNDLLGRVDGPSRGALYSKWRNDVRGQLLELEREKMEIFRSILADGLDPLINVIGEGGDTTKKKMSEVVSDFEKAFPDYAPAKASEPKVKQPSLKIVKFPTNPNQQ